MPAAPITMKIEPPRTPSAQSFFFASLAVNYFHSTLTLLCLYRAHTGKPETCCKLYFRSTPRKQTSYLSYFYAKAKKYDILSISIDGRMAT